MGGAIGAADAPGVCAGFRFDNNIVKTPNEPQKKNDQQNDNKDPGDSKSDTRGNKSHLSSWQQFQQGKHGEILGFLHRGILRSLRS